MLNFRVFFTLHVEQFRSSPNNRPTKTDTENLVGKPPDALKAVRASQQG